MFYRREMSSRLLPPRGREQAQPALLPAATLECVPRAVSRTRTGRCCDRIHTPANLRRGGSTGDAREQLLERADADAVRHGWIDVVEQLVQRLLRVTERALEMRVVASPHHVLPAHRRARLHRRAVVL